MERGIYFDGWYKHNHCYHPSLPLRSRQMLEDLERYHGTVEGSEIILKNAGLYTIVAF